VSDSLADKTEIEALRAIVEVTASATGEEFFRSLVKNLAKALGVENAFVAEFAGRPSRVRTLAYWLDGRHGENLEWDLSGTPCEDVVQGKLCHHPEKVAATFPEDAGLAGIESYLGVPLKDAGGTILGHLAVYDPKPMPAEPRLLFTFQIFAARAAAELDRLRGEARLHDLFDEAPIAYVNEDLDSRFIRANRTALRILGLSPEQAVGFRGLSLVPDTPEAQALAKAAFESINRGMDTSGVVLELRRFDTGAPIWIQWWSRPDPSGTYTRTMFVDITERVLMEREKARLAAQNQYYQDEIKAAHNFEEIVGQSPKLLAVLQRVSKVASTESTVLIHGETGTGKELIARAIHSASPRKGKPLIKLNCAALPAGLVESELFGHEKGAFTGATQKRPGRFELADGGTLFLDEISELPLEAQAKLLRVLQEREFERVGGTAAIPVDVRIIAATNRDLAAMAKEKMFREDLYYRLNVFPVQLPALRERRDDVPLLVQFFARRFAARMARKLDGVARETVELLAAYDWPGNIRELENVIERAMILNDGPLLEIDPELLGVAVEPGEASAKSLSNVQREHILAVLGQSNWVIEGPAGAAMVLAMHPNTLRSRMKKLGITRP
jgi:PAS domain S-box-containing protein